MLSAKGYEQFRGKGTSNGGVERGRFMLLEETKTAAYQGSMLTAAVKWEQEEWAAET